MPVFLCAYVFFWGGGLTLHHKLPIQYYYHRYGTSHMKLLVYCNYKTLPILTQLMKEGDMHIALLVLRLRGVGKGGTAFEKGHSSPTFAVNNFLLSAMPMRGRKRVMPLHRQMTLSISINV